MATNKEMLDIIKSGSRDDQVDLFNELMNKVAQGEVLAQGEITMLQYLKGIVTQDQGPVVQMSASILGKGLTSV